MIETCAQIHRILWYPENLAVAQGYGKKPRDEALLKDLAIKLGIPNEHFILSDESKGISAQQYLLMAMLEVLEPLSAMFQEIWKYCERTMTRTSKNTLDISWNFNIQDEQVTINFEAFRRYRQMLARVPTRMSSMTSAMASLTRASNIRLGCTRNRLSYHPSLMAQ